MENERVIAQYNMGEVSLEPIIMGISANEQRLLALRQHLMNNIQLADNKAHQLICLETDEKMISLYLDTISPRTTMASDAPTGFNQFGLNHENELQYECDILKSILETKLANIVKMIEHVRAYRVRTRYLKHIDEKTEGDE